MNHGINAIFQHFIISRKIVIIPKEFGCQRARTGTGMSVRIKPFHFVTKRARTDYPAAIFGVIFGIGIFYPVLGVFFRALHIRLVKFYVRLERFRYISTESNPIIHLNIDIVPKAAPPRRFIVRSPHALQRRRRRAFSRGRKQQISAVLII